jgi:transglutaminase-like putative cysteine protease
VQFVWDGRYAGISFPRKKTTVLEVQAPKSASLYWRAAVLDDFDGAGWVGVGAGPGDALEPPAAYVARNQTTQVVTVRALSDTRLVGGSTPIAFDVGSAPVVSPAPGFAFLPAGLTRDFRYTARSYAPQPTAAMLERSPAAYPKVLTSPGAFLDVSPGVTMPPFGAPARAARVSRIVARPGLHAYTGLAQTAATVVRKARTPYEAAVALEAWFRAPGRFRYSNHPPYDPAAPLAAFVTRTRVGYCQYFAGAMVLMLRYAGVPARVAVGFSSGRYDARKRAWVVTDHDAHAWVEAWFAGYGWLPFDPTPSAGRPEQGALSAAYSASSPEFRTSGGAARAVDGPSPAQQSGHRHGESDTGAAGGSQSGLAAAGSASHAVRNALLFLLAVVLGGGVGGIAFTKLLVRSLR